MKRREFTLSLGAAAVLTACGGGGGGSTTEAGTAPPAGGAAEPPSPAPSPAPAPAPSYPALATQFAIGTNLASMELGGALRFGPSTMPNVNFTVPRQQDIEYLRGNGFSKSRLPIRWEMLQPVLHDAKPNDATRAIVGNPGEFHPGYAAYITQVLDAHAAAGTKCILDIHNYCRYTDFIYQPDGSVIGLVKPNNPVLHPYTSDPQQVQFRIMALAEGATLTIAHYVDFMSRIAKTWKGHPGLGGYGMMNEPYYMPKPGTIVESFEGWGQDLTIWPKFAEAGVKAVRAIDPDTWIYLGGNNWHRAWGLGSENPGFPIDAPNIVYDVHCYLDAFNSGAGVDWELETAKKYSAGVSDTAPIDAMTGVNRLQKALDFTVPRKLPLAVTETGMPSDDPRWQASWLNMIQLAKENNVEVYSWAGGAHWSYRNRAITHVSGWHQNKVLESQQAGTMKVVAKNWKAAIFDDGPGSATGGAGVTITVYARGALQQPVTITVASDNGGTFSKTTLIIPAGANGSDSFTFTPKANTVTTLSYASDTAPNVPPARKVYSLADPVAHAATNLAEGAMAILAKYGASKWEMSDGYTDPLTATPAADGQELRAVSDSGFGSSVGNAMEMLNGFNTSPGMGPYTTPVMRTLNARKCADLTAPNAFGLWCRKRLVSDVDPKARQVVPFGLGDAHFAIAAISVPGTTTGLVFQASTADQGQFSALSLEAGKPEARWVDDAGKVVALTSSTPLAPNQSAVVSFVSDGSTQQLRVGSAVAKSGANSLPKVPYDQLLLGAGFDQHYPKPGFGGYLFAAIAGKGAPSPEEMRVLESYLMTTAA